jgi:hypothetical protein
VILQRGRRDASTGAGGRRAELSYPDSVDTRLLALLDNVAWAKRNCSHCDRPLWFMRVNGGYNVAYTSE